MSAAHFWDYGGAHRRVDVSSGVIDLPHGSKVQVADWLDELPPFMREADTLFVDPPWSVGNLRTFYTKADLAHRPIGFEGFINRLFFRIADIRPKFLFLEIGKEAIDLALTFAKSQFKYVTFYNSTYYKKQANKCYIIHATNEANRRRYPVLEDMGQAQIVEWLCGHHDFDCIGDLCMGRGLVGRSAYRAGKHFVGTELNPKRLAVLVEWIKEQESQRDIAKPD